MQRITDFTKLKVGDKVFVKWRWTKKETSSLLGVICCSVPIGAECVISVSNLFKPGDRTILTNNLFNNLFDKDFPVGYKIIQAVTLTDSEYNIHMI